MPGFIYTIIVISIGFWAFIIRWMITTRPETPVNILTFLVLLFFALSLTFSLLFYYYFYRISPTLIKLRAVYRRGAKWGFFLSAGIVFLLGMKAFKVFNIINLLLFGVLYYALYIQLRAKR